MSYCPLETKGHQEWRTWWALLSATVLTPVQAIFSRLANLVSAGDEHMGYKLGVLVTHCNCIAEKGWRPVSPPWNMVTQAGAGPRAGAVRHPHLPPAPSTAPWHVWGCYFFLAFCCVWLFYCITERSCKTGSEEAHLLSASSSSTAGEIELLQKSLHIWDEHPNIYNLQRTCVPGRVNQTSVIFSRSNPQLFWISAPWSEAADLPSEVACGGWEEKAASLKWRIRQKSFTFWLQLSCCRRVVLAGCEAEDCPGGAQEQIMAQVCQGCL